MKGNLESKVFDQDQVLRTNRSWQLFLGVVFLFSTACAQPNGQDQLWSVGANDVSFIVNGRPVTDEDFAAKSTVALYLAVSNRFVNFCTGTLIGEEYVLTAAHCFVEIAKRSKMPVEILAKSVRVVFGKKVVNQENDQRVQVRKVSAIKVHELYRSESLENVMTEPMYDIMVIRLDQKAPADFVPAPLLNNINAIQKGQEITLAGYGLLSGIFDRSASELMQVTTAITYPRFSKTQFVYTVQDGKSSCSGDSGGPAYLRVDNKTYLAGVTSWGDGNCEQLGAYTSVPVFVSWIESAISELSQPARISENPSDSKLQFSAALTH